MLQYDVSRAKYAVQFLVDSPYAKHHVKRLRNVVQQPRALPFSGDAEVLNELLIVGRQSKTAMENLIEVAEFKRKQKPNYMTDFMRQKRARERKLVEIEEVGLGRKLTLDERVQLVQSTRDRWAREKQIHIEQRTEAHTIQFGTPPNWATSNQFIKDFWQMKDLELDVLMERAKQFAAEQHHPRRYVVRVEPVARKPRNPTMREQLERALKK